MPMTTVSTVNTVVIGIALIQFKGRLKNLS